MASLELSRGTLDFSQLGVGLEFPVEGLSSVAGILFTAGCSAAFRACIVSSKLISRVSILKLFEALVVLIASTMGRSSCLSSWVEACDWLSADLADLEGLDPLFVSGIGR